MLKEAKMDGFLFSTDRRKLNLDYVHEFISSQSYWAQNIPIETMKLAIENSCCFGIYKDGTQVGFARLVTDYATFAYLADVFIDPAWRKNGLSKKLMEFIQQIDELRSLRRMVLVTRDAHKLYTRYGFKSLASPDNYMELHRPDVYKKN